MSQAEDKDSDDYVFKDEPWRGDLEHLAVEAEAVIADLDWETGTPAQLRKDVGLLQTKLDDVEEFLKKIEPKTEDKKKPVVKAQPAQAGVVVASPPPGAPPPSEQKKRKSSPEKDKEKEPKRAKRVEFKETSSFVVFDDPGDPCLSWFTTGHVHKYYVCATRKLAEEKKRQMEDECAQKFFEWLQAHKDELVVKGKPKRGGGSISGITWDLRINWSLSLVPMFKTEAAANAFARFIQTVRDGKVPSNNYAGKAMCLAMLRPDMHIARASTLKADETTE